MKTIMMVAALSALVGCASTTGVVPTGKDTFMIATHGVMGHSSAGMQKAEAFRQASDYCKTLGKELQPINTGETQGGFGKIAAAEVEFTCLAKQSAAR
ncbi:hypothetical protein ACFDR9_004494 [Janthinobacterium sp. CG_23.3]|uniref:hypothetical protein n=1 Tax=Janthinobacterium sp. CG_23.3 TaxID=3349634 RepID=UPI0038D3911B